MKPRRSRRPPPDDAEHIVGEGFELSTDDDRVNAGKPLPPTVDVTPTGPEVTVFELQPEDDKVAHPEPPKDRREQQP
jgi:hypothetical protein